MKFRPQIEETVPHLFEVGDPILRQAKEIEDKKLEIKKLQEELAQMRIDLTIDVGNLWSNKEINEAKEAAAKEKN